ncbi:MAG: polysaccharide deacetylase family protein [Spirochaetes bacterium]|nr:polysaccharide deacetylase family protein [Spirochaetota bacterium]
MKIAIPILSSLLIVMNAERQPSVRVLCYHTFKDAKNMYSFSIDEFRGQIDFLRCKGFTFVSAGDIVTGRVRGNRNVLITIDDGNVSVYRAVREVLRPRGIRPLLAIYPNVIGKKSYALTWEQLAELTRDGCDIAAHGYYHSLLNDKTYERNRGSFHKEIVESKRVLEEKLRIRVDYFVYPFGVGSARAVRMVRDAGYRLAFTIRPGSFPVPVYREPHELPRYMLTRGTWKWQMHAISGALPGEPAADSVHLIARTDPGKQERAEPAKSRQGASKEPAREERRGASEIRVTITTAGSSAAEKRVKEAAPDRDRKTEREQRKRRRRREREEKEVAVVAPLRRPSAGDREPGVAQGASPLYENIRQVQPADGDLIVGDIQTAYAGIDAPASEGGRDDVPLFHHARGTGTRGGSPGGVLRQEYFSLAHGSCRSYSALMERMEDRFSDLKRSVEQLIGRVRRQRG